MDAAKHFYGAVFGWQLETSANAAAGGEYTQVGVGDKQVAGIMAKADVDGALIGGASLDPDEFVGIVRFRLHPPELVG